VFPCTLSLAGVTVSENPIAPPLLSSKRETFCCGRLTWCRLPLPLILSIKVKLIDSGTLYRLYFRWNGRYHLRVF
jgi:hypothetical protein